MTNYSFRDDLSTTIYIAFAYIALRPDIDNVQESHYTDTRTLWNDRLYIAAGINSIGETFRPSFIIHKNEEID